MITGIIRADSASRELNGPIQAAYPPSRAPCVRGADHAARWTSVFGFLGRADPDGAWTEPYGFGKAPPWMV